MLRLITWVGTCVRGSLHGWGHVWGHPPDNGVTHSGKGSILVSGVVSPHLLGEILRVALVSFSQF